MYATKVEKRTERIAKRTERIILSKHNKKNMANFGHFEKNMGQIEKKLNKNEFGIRIKLLPLGRV